MHPSQNSASLNSNSSGILQRGPKALQFGLHNVLWPCCGRHGRLHPRSTGQSTSFGDVRFNLRLDAALKERHGGAWVDRHMHLGKSQPVRSGSYVGKCEYCTVAIDRLW